MAQSHNPLCEALTSKNFDVPQCQTNLDTRLRQAPPKVGSQC